jgi:hypothetical protein
VAGFCERGDEALGSCTTELVSMLVWSVFCVVSELDVGITVM